MHASTKYVYPSNYNTFFDLGIYLDSRGLNIKIRNNAGMVTGPDDGQWEYIDKGIDKENWSR